MANEPKIQTIAIQTSLDAPQLFPKIQDIGIQTIAPPSVQEVRFTTTQPAPTGYPKLQEVQFKILGPTYWLNGLAQGDLFPSSNPQNESNFTFFID